MNAMLLKVRSKVTFHQWAILELLDRKTPCSFRYNLWTIERIASVLRITRQTVLTAFHRFAELGLIARIKGASLGALRDALGWRPFIRAATDLLWRSPAENRDACCNERQIPWRDERQNPWRNFDPPPKNPPLEQTDKNQGEDDDDLARSRAPACEAAQPPIQPQPPRSPKDPASPKAPACEGGQSSSSPESFRRATREEVDQVIARAKALFPHEHFLAARVKTEARRCARHGGGLSWIDRALELAERKGAEKWGYVAATLKNWREEGGPPAPPPTAEEQKAKRDADIAAATLRLFGARPGGPST